MTNFNPFIHFFWGIFGPVDDSLSLPLGIGSPHWEIDFLFRWTEEKMFFVCMHGVRCECPENWQKCI